MNRRDFLKMAGVSGVAASLGSVIYRASHWWNQPSAASYDVLSREEVEIARAIGDALFPGEDYMQGGMPNGVDAGVVEHLDGYLAAVNPDSSRLLRLLFHAIDDVAILSDFGFTRFRNRPREERIAILKAWDNSKIAFRRKAFRGLKLILAGGFCSHPEVRQAIGMHFRCGGPA